MSMHGYLVALLQFLPKPPNGDPAKWRQFAVTSCPLVGLALDTSPGRSRMKPASLKAPPKKKAIENAFPTVLNLRVIEIQYVVKLRVEQSIVRQYTAVECVINPALDVV
jgi:hypothetical protein